MPAAGSQGADGAPARGSIWHRYTPTLVQLCPEQKRRNAAESGDCARGAARREPQRGRERRAGEHSNRSFPRPRSVLFLAGSPPAPPCAVTRSPGRGLRRNLRWGPRARTEGPRATPPGGTCSVPAPPRAGGQRRLAGVRGRWRRGRAAALWGERCMGARRCAGPAAVRLLPALRSAPLHCSPVATPVRSGGSGKGFRRGGGVGWGWNGERAAGPRRVTMGVRCSAPLLSAGIGPLRPRCPRRGGREGLPRHYGSGRAPARPLEGGFPALPSLLLAGAITRSGLLACLLPFGLFSFRWGRLALVGESLIARSVGAFLFQRQVRCLESLNYLCCLCSPVHAASASSSPPPPPRLPAQPL